MFEVLLRYALATHRSMSVERASKLFEVGTGPTARKIVSTALDDWKLKAERKGHAKVLVEILAQRFSRMLREVRARVMAADQATLERWTTRVLTAPTLEAVLDDTTALPPKRPRARKRGTCKMAP